MTGKLPNWDVELVKFCNLARHFGHSYGMSDCVLFAAGAVEVQTGVDMAAGHAGRYSSHAEAEAYMAERGWLTVDDVASAFLPKIDVRDIRRGDIIAVDGEAGRCLGVSLGRESMVMSATGAVMIRTANAKAAWGVGHA